MNGCEKPIKIMTVKISQTRKLKYKATRNKLWIYTDWFRSIEFIQNYAGKSEIRIKIEVERIARKKKIK